MKRRLSLLNIVLISYLGIFLTACGGSPDKKTSCDNKTSTSAGCTLTEEEKQEENRKAQEERQKRQAFRSSVLVESQSVKIVDYSPTKLALRLVLRLNNKLRSTIYSMEIDQNLQEQFDLQDKTSEISTLFPNNNWEISAFKLKGRATDFLALEYRFLNNSANKYSSASQFILVSLSQDLSSGVVIKTQFEFPTTTDLKVWAKKQVKNTWSLHDSL